MAAAHVSKNLGLNFACLKADMADMTGTGSAGFILLDQHVHEIKVDESGTTIQTLSPTANSKTESHKATKQADQDINDSNL